MRGILARTHMAGDQAGWWTLAPWFSDLSYPTFPILIATSGLNAPWPTRQVQNATLKAGRDHAHRI